MLVSLIQTLFILNLDQRSFSIIVAEWAGESALFQSAPSVVGKMRKTPSFHLFQSGRLTVDRLARAIDHRKREILTGYMKNRVEKTTSRKYQKNKT